LLHRGKARWNPADLSDMLPALPCCGAFMHQAQTVSVIIPAWNAAGFVRRAIRSALSEQEGALPDGTALALHEVIVIDDCSSDATMDVVRQLAQSEPRLKLLRNAHNLGPGGTRNAGIAAASGDWIAVLDADDAYAPGRLPRLIGAALGNGFDIMADLPVLYDLAAGAAAPQQLPASGRVQPVVLADLLRPDPETGLDLGLLKPVFRRRLAEAQLWRYPERVRHGEDFALYFDLVKRGESFGLLHEALYIFSTRIGAISGSYSPGSVTNVDYRAIAAHASALAQDYGRETGAKAEVLTLLEARKNRALHQNRIYGWTLLRKGEWLRLTRWLWLDRRNAAALARAIGAKLKGHRGLPD
jgi:succinoglycan biosynthesis protein ExoO